MGLPFKQLSNCRLLNNCPATSSQLSTLIEVFLNLTDGFLTLTEVFPCFFLRCKANARVNLTKKGHGLHTSTLVVVLFGCYLCCSMYYLFVCKCVLPPGDNLIAVNTLRTGSFKLLKTPVPGVFNNFNPFNAELNPICYLLVLLAHHFLHVSRIRVKSLTLRLLMSYIYIYIWSTYS